MKILQKVMIKFTPPLPSRKQKAIKNVRIWDGCKAFIEFSKKFYPTINEIQSNSKKAGQKLYYDAPYGQIRSQHILGLFAVGSEATAYSKLHEAYVIEHLFKELDVLFGGEASKNYVKHTFQNLTQEPFIYGSYVMDYEKWKTVKTLG